MSLNVLVVDDSAVMRSMIIKTLRLSGVPLQEVHQAGNGAEGLDVLNSHWIDLALVDINMPVMDGEEMIDRVRADVSTQDLSLVVVSTESSATRIASLEAKGARFVHKPFTPESLRRTILDVTGIANEQQLDGGHLPGNGPDF